MLSNHFCVIKIIMTHPSTCPENPLVTVVIPAYNAAAFIESTLISVIGQTYRNLEIVVVDDGSTDETAAIVSGFAERNPRIRLLKQQNAGLSAARNLGIRAAVGEYIANLDADDVWCSKNVERQLAAIRDAPFEVKVAYGWSLGIDEANRLNGGFYISFLEGRVFPALVYKFFISNASASLIHRSCFETFGVYDTRYHQEKAQGCEDWDLHLRFAKHYHFTIAPSFVTGYRQTITNMSSNDTTMARSYQITMDNARRQCPDIPDEVFHWSRSNFALYLALNRSRAGDFRAAWKWLLKALINDPWMAIMRHDFHMVLIRSLADAFVQCVSQWFVGRKTSFSQLKNRLFRKQTGITTSRIFRHIDIYHRLPAQRWERRRIKKILTL